MAMLSRDDLLAAGPPASDVVTITAGDVRIRALTRAEAIKVRTRGKGWAAQEPLILHFGMADPELSVEDAETWLEVAPAGDVQRLVEAIGRLSGMDAATPKEATKSAARRR